MTVSQKRKRLFISHSSSDRIFADEVRRGLEMRGFDSWFLGVDDPGEETRADLERGLLEADVYVVFLSSDSLSSPWVLFEVGTAAGRRKKIVPVLLTDFALQHSPAIISRFRAVDAQGQSAAHVAESIGELLEE